MAGRSAANSILAKVRSKYGKSLTVQNYRDMAALSGVSDVAAYLKTRTKYRTSLDKVQEAAVHRGNLERILRMGFSEELRGLCTFEHSVGDPLFAGFMAEEELRYLKAYVRCLSSGKPESFAELSPGVSFSRICVDCSRLNLAFNYQMMLECVTDAELRRILSQYRTDDETVTDVADILSVIDKFGYKYRRDIIMKNYIGATRDKLIEMIDMRAELDDLRLAVRGRKYFSVDLNQLRAMMTDASAHFTKGQAEQIRSAVTEDEIFSVVKRSPYVRDVADITQKDVDTFAKCVLYRTYRKAIRMTTSPAVAMYCYVGLTRIEIDNITTVIEGVRYGVDADKITELLICS